MSAILKKVVIVEASDVEDFNNKAAWMIEKKFRPGGPAQRGEDGVYWQEWLLVDVPVPEERHIVGVSKEGKLV